MTFTVKLIDFAPEGNPKMARPANVMADNYLLVHSGDGTA
jgi:hypothetical protein